MIDARDYLSELYGKGLLNDGTVQNLIYWLTTDAAEDFCKINDLGYMEYEEEEEK